MEKKNKLAILANGLIKENPVLVLVLGTCPTLATSTSVVNGFGMGLSATAVLICFRHDRPAGRQGICPGSGQVPGSVSSPDRC